MLPFVRIWTSQTLPVKQFKLNIAKKEVDFIETSFKPYGLSCMSNPAFLNNVIEFGKMGKDKINEETIEFLVPYLEVEGFNPQVNGKLSRVVQHALSCHRENSILLLGALSSISAIKCRSILGTLLHSTYVIGSVKRSVLTRKSAEPMTQRQISSRVADGALGVSQLKGSGPDQHLVTLCLSEP